MISEKIKKSFDVDSNLLDSESENSICTSVMLNDYSNSSIESTTLLSDSNFASLCPQTVT